MYIPPRTSCEFYFARLFCIVLLCIAWRNCLKNFTVSDIMISMHMLYRLTKGIHQFVANLVIYTVSQKGNTILLSISLLNIDWFSQFFHRRTQLELCNKIINKHPNSPQMCCYTTLWNVPTRQCTGALGTRDNHAAATGDACIHLTWSVASE